jgi:superfamily I DNA and RNA helicase
METRWPAPTCRKLRWGQSAPAVIFTGIDFEQIDELAFRKLFVRMTRARLKLVLVLSERAAEQLLDRIST